MKPVATILVHRRLDDALSGSGVYLSALIDRLLEAGFAVRFVCTPISSFGSIPISRPARSFTARGCEIDWPDTVRVGPYYISRSAAVWRRALARTWQLINWYLRRHRGAPRPSFPNTLGRPPTAYDHLGLIKSANRLHSTIVIAEYSSLAPTLGTCRAHRRAVLLHDVFSLRARSFREAELPPDHAAVPLQCELDWLRDADLCIYASAIEARELAGALPGKRHIWMPPAVHRQSPQAGGTPRAVFIGVRHGGNRDALNFLLRDIWPGVLSALPAAELLIIGEIGAEIRTPPDGVRVLGRVKDLSAFGGASSIGLAPVRAASGASIKIVTYLELGMCVLASTKALEGYDGALDDLVVSADSAASFRDKLIALLSDTELREGRARHGARLIGNRIDNRELSEYFSELLQDL